MIVRRSTLLVGSALAGMLALAGCDTASAPTSPQSGVSLTGNGTPSGPHFDLNLIGIEQADRQMPDNAGGHVIFVRLYGRTDIELTADDTEPYDFAVLDKDGTDGEAAFQLPVDVSFTYDVYARALGKPGGTANLATCAVDPTTLEELCSTATLDDLQHLVGKGNGPPKFTNVSGELLFIQIDLTQFATDDPLVTCLEQNSDVKITQGGDLATVPLFNDCLQGYFWKYDNNGLRLLQLRFYPVPVS